METIAQRSVETGAAAGGPLLAADAAGSAMIEQRIEMASFTDIVRSVCFWGRQGRLSTFLKSPRSLVLVAVLCSIAAAMGGMADRLSGSSAAWIERMAAVLFVVNFAWISLFFWNAAAGFFKLWFGWKTDGIKWPERQLEAAPLASRNAILMPVHNEDPARVYAGLQAIYESLAQTGFLRSFDFFILSDSTRPATWMKEEVGWKKLCQTLGGNPRIFYRRRRKNTGKKAGNISDFCRRWGHCYDSMIILDADSIMTGATIVTLARLMDLNERVGIIQVPSYTVNHVTLFARIQQFAARLYGPLIFGGLSFWQMGDGNYWGHNAIIRVSAFIRNCGLPKLPGNPPLGGYIRSHDFVEAALMCRGGSTVLLLPELSGSYEEAPPNILDYIKRDWRWCQGNLQHVRILPAKGLHGASRLHLAIGIMSYLSSLLWLAFLLSSLVCAVHYLHVRTLTLSLAMKTQRPDMFQIGLLVAMVVMLIGPRLLSFGLLLRYREMARQFGGFGRAFLGMILETLFSALLAPTMMLFQSGFVISTFLERDIGWSCQQRDDKGISVPEAVKGLWVECLIGIALALIVYNISAMLLVLFLPVIAGLVLSIPLSCLSSRGSIGGWAREHKMFLIPEEIEPPAVLARLTALLWNWRRTLSGR
jgi:membrane glycosyltransferase